MKTYTKKEFEADPGVTDPGRSFEENFSKFFGTWRELNGNCGCVLFVDEIPVDKGELVFRAYKNCCICLGKGKPPIHWDELK